MKASPLSFLVAATVVLPAHVAAQLPAAVDMASPIRHSSAAVLMRPSMVARYATVPSAVDVAPFARPPRTALVRQLLGAAVTVAAVVSRAHPLLPTADWMVRHDH